VCVAFHCSESLFTVEYLNFSFADNSTIIPGIDTRCWAFINVGNTCSPVSHDSLFHWLVESLMLYVSY